MKLTLQFGLNEPKRIVNWWQHITDFPVLVLFKNEKWEFVMYGADDTKQTEYICHFSPVKGYDPNWHATTYVDISNMLTNTYGTNCECGAIYTSSQNHHMFFCPKWQKS